MEKTQNGHNGSGYRRRIYWIEPGFQRRFLMRLMGSASIAVLVTFAVCMALLWWQDKKTAGTFFYLTPDATQSPLLLNRMGIILPMLFVSEAIVLALMGVIGLFYSHRLAGPMHKIKMNLEAHIRGESVTPITLRQGDEFKDLADSLNRLFYKS